MNTHLNQTILRFTTLTQALTDADLERSWQWGEYAEGVRFAFFRLYEQLSTLAARLETPRPAAPPVPLAWRILGQYHAAYLDLQAVLLGVTDDLARQTFAEGEWPLRQILAHIVQAERGFFTANALGLEHARAQKGLFEMTEEAWNTFWADAPFADLSEHGAFSALQAYHAALHPRILAGFKDVRDEELQIPIKFWETQPLPLEFRLHRFHSHLRQHTIQVEKTLVGLGHLPTEARRLLRLVYQALAQVEGALIGDAALDQAQCDHLSGEIARMTDEIVLSLA